MLQFPFCLLHDKSSSSPYRATPLEKNVPVLNANHNGHKEMQLKTFHTVEQDTVGFGVSAFFTPYSQSCFIWKETMRYYYCTPFLPSAEQVGTLVFESVTKDSAQKLPDGEIRRQRHTLGIGPFDSICSVMFLKSIESLQKLPVSQVSKVGGP